MSFTEKKITVVLSLANGQFQGGGNTATISDMRVSCVILNTGGASQGQMTMAIFGLPLSTMNQLKGPPVLRKYQFIFAGSEIDLQNQHSRTAP